MVALVVGFPFAAAAAAVAAVVVVVVVAAVVVVAGDGDEYLGVSVLDAREVTQSLSWLPH